VAFLSPAFFFLSSSTSSGKILETTPAAMVLPPSLRANLYPIATGRGKFNFNLAIILSPGIPIFYSPGRLISTATSAVLKKIYGL